MAHSADPLLRVACSRLLYQLSCAAANQPRLRADGELMLALQKARSSMCHCTDRFMAILTLINLFKPVSSSSSSSSSAASRQPATQAAAAAVSVEYNADLIGTVHWAFARELTPHADNMFSPVLLAVRTLAADESCRQKLWSMYGLDGGILGLEGGRDRKGDEVTHETDLKPFVPLVLDALEKGLGWDFGCGVVEHAIAVLVQFSGDLGGARAALRRDMPRIYRLLSRVPNDKAEFYVASRAAQFLLRRLTTPVAGDEEEGEDGRLLQPPAQRQLTKRDVIRRMDGGKKWDRFMQEVLTLQDLGNVVHMALIKRAPFHVLEYLVCTRRVQDLNRISSDGLLDLPIMIACQQERVDVVLMMLDCGADAFVIGKEGQTLLMQSCSHESLTPVTRRVVEMAIERGDSEGGGKAYLDYAHQAEPDDDVSGALAYCTCQGKGLGLEQARILLEAGASPNVCDRESSSPLALAMRWPDMDMCRLLFKHGADPGTPTMFVDRLFRELAVASENDTNTEEVLLELMALLVDDEIVPERSRPEKDSATGLLSANLIMPYSPLVYGYTDIPSSVTRRWLKLGGNPDTCLQLALTTGRLADAELFLQCGADPNIFINSTAMMLCRLVREGWRKPEESGATAADILAETMHLRIKSGWEPSRADLVEAVQAGDVSQVNLLLQAGVAATGKPSLFELAKKRGHVALLPYLVTKEDRKKHGKAAPAQQSAGVFDEGDNIGFGFTFTMCAYCRKDGGGVCRVHHGGLLRRDVPARALDGQAQADVQDEEGDGREAEEQGRTGLNLN